jgi:hypothetical protein
VIYLWKFIGDMYLSWWIYWWSWNLPMLMIDEKTLKTDVDNCWWENIESNQLFFNRKWELTCKLRPLSADNSGEMSIVNHGSWFTAYPQINTNYPSSRHTHMAHASMPPLVAIDSINWFGESNDGAGASSSEKAAFLGPRVPCLKGNWVHRDWFECLNAETETVCT